MISLLQDINGGYGAGGGGGSGNSTTAVGFSASTTAGSLLICAVYVTGQDTVPNPPVTSGVTWVEVQSSGYTGALSGGCALYASYDTTSIPPTSTTQILIGTNTAVDVEFDLYEFGGVIAAPLDTSANGTGPTSGNVTANPTSVNQAGSGWQGYLPYLINPRGFITTTTTGWDAIVDNTTGDTSIAYVNTFALGIPSGATIEGVAVTFTGATYVHSGTPVSNNKGVQVSLQNGATPIGTAKQQFFTSQTAAVFTLGNSTDTWSASLSPTTCNASSFGIGFMQLGAHSTDAAPVICNCSIQVWYNDPSEPTGTANLMTTSSDLIFVIGQGADSSGSYAPAGSGYTLGLQTFLCNFGEAQYQMNIPAGSTPTAFGSPMGGQNWACVAAAFEGTPASGTATPTGVSMMTALGPTQPGIPIDYGNGGGGTSAPLPSGVNSTYFYARWVGFLTPSVSGIYTVGLNYSDGADFYIGSQPIVTDLNGMQISNPADPSTGIPEYVTSSQIALVKNVAYPVVIEWQHGGGADFELQFLWTPPSRTNGPPGVTEVIPEANISLVGSWWNGTSSQWYPTVWYGLTPVLLLWHNMQYAYYLSDHVLPSVLHTGWQVLRWLHLV